MGSAEEPEALYDSLEEEAEEARCVVVPFLQAFRTPPNTSRFLNCFDNLGATTRATTLSRRNLTVSPATDAEDMDHLATAFQNLSLEDASRSARRNVRRSKSCTSLLGGKKTTTSKLRQESFTSFKSKCTSYLEMYQRRKNVKGHKQRRHEKTPTEPDPVPPPTTRTSYDDDDDDLSCSSSLRDLENATYRNVGDFKAFPADVDRYMSINLNEDGLDWRPRNVVHLLSSDPGGGGGGVKHRSYVPYSIKDYKSLQVPKLGSLGYDREAVRDKYEKMKRQRAYGMQASVRNRSKMALAHNNKQAPTPTTVATTVALDQKAAPPKPDKNHQQSKAIRRHAHKSRPKKPQGDGQSSLDLQPLVERHLKEMQASAIIRQNFMCL